jgi:hypothetical protein
MTALLLFSDDVLSSRISVAREIPLQKIPRDGSSQVCQVLRLQSLRKSHEKQPRLFLHFLHREIQPGAENIHLSGLSTFSNRFVNTLYENSDSAATTSSYLKLLGRINVRVCGRGGNSLA